MWTGGPRNHNRTTPVHWPLATGHYSLAPTCCPLTMDSYSADAAQQLGVVSHMHATWRDDRTGWPPYRWRHHLLLLAISVILHRVLPSPEATCRALGLIVTVRPWAIKGPGRRHILLSLLRAKSTFGQNTAIQLSFFCERRVLRFGGPNHVNSRVHRVPS
jgi:hypothetical protein